MRLGRAIATDGTRVVVVGGRSVPPCVPNPPESTGGGPECATAPIAWTSDDGVKWRVSYPPADGEFVAVWQVAGRGWTAAEVAGIEAYQGKETRYYLPTLAEFRSIVAPHFAELECSVADYELAERCPTFVFQSRK